MVVEYMLGNWCSHNNRQIPNSCWIAAKQDLLGEIAYQFSFERKDIFTIQDLRSKIEKYLKNPSISTDFINKNTSQLIAELSQQDGILQNLSGDNKKYLFLHRTFQEYFTALHLKHLIETDINRGISLVKTNLYKYEWHETLSLLAGLLDNPIPLLKAISLEKDDIFHSLLLLSGECIAECREQSYPFMQKIIEEIYELWQSRPHIVFVTVVVERIAYTNNIMQEKLLNVALKHSCSEVRCEAVKILGKTANLQVVEAFMETINDKDISVRFWSALSLGCIEEETAIKACIIQAINENNPNVIKAIFTSFKINQSPKIIIKILKKYLKYINELSFQIFISKFQDYVIQCCINYEYREFYINDFYRIHNFNIINLLLECSSFLHSIFMKETIVLFGEIGDNDVVDCLMQVLEPLEDKFKQWLSKILEIRNDSLGIFLDNQHYYDDEIYNVLTQKIIQELRKTDTQERINQAIKEIYLRCVEVRKKAIISLGQIGHAKAINILNKAIHDLDDEVRVEAAIALIKINSLPAFETLKQVVNNSSNIKRAVIMALGKMNIPQAIELLTQFIEDQDRDIRWRAVTALGEIGNSQSVKILIGYLNHSDNDVRREAFAALAEISTPEVIECLIYALKQKKHEDKKWVAAALGKIKWFAQELKHYKNLEVVESLIDSLNDSDSYVRRWIAVALGKIRHPHAVKALILALDDPDATVRKYVAIALGRSSHFTAVMALASKIQDKDNSVREQAVLALERIGDPRATKALISALTSPDNYFKMIAAAILVKIQWNIHIIRLIFKKIYFSNLKKSDSVLLFSDIISKLDPSDKSIRCRAATALGEIGSPEAVKFLIRSLVDPNSDVRGRAAAALGKIRCSKSITALIQALSHPDVAVQQEAIAALKHIGNSKVLKSLVQSFTIDLDDPDIYTLARILAVRVSMTQEHNKLIPLYPRKNKFIDAP
ncbi:HEAT repeat domain-containing protein [Anabaena sp. CCY 9613]